MTDPIGVPPANAPKAPPGYVYVWAFNPTTGRRGWELMLSEGPPPCGYSEASGVCPYIDTEHCRTRCGGRQIV
jgi:hypothetical protein